MKSILKHLFVTRKETARVIIQSINVDSCLDTAQTCWKSVQCSLSGASLCN